jgi:hypothetical protein
MLNLAAYRLNWRSLGIEKWITVPVTVGRFISKARQQILICDILQNQEVVEALHLSAFGRKGSSPRRR